MNVCVVMFYDKHIERFGNINYNINKIYCEKHCIDIFCENTKTQNIRSLHWEKIYTVLKYLDKYDYVIWIDADAFFYLDAPNILDIIIENNKSDFIFSNDVSNCNINTGFFIVKNSNYSFKFLEKWGYDGELYKKSESKKRWNDQEALIILFDENIFDIKSYSITYDFGILQSFSEKNHGNDYPYVMHSAGKQKNEKLEISKKYWKKIKSRCNSS
jgi:hypothetical protein